MSKDTWHREDLLQLVKEAQEHEHLREGYLEKVEHHSAIIIFEITPPTLLLCSSG